MQNMQNKPNLPNAQMNISSVPRKAYMKNDAFAPPKNEPNSNPIKANSNPIPPARYAIRNTRYEIQTQFYPHHCAVNEKCELANGENHFVTVECSVRIYTWGTVFA